MSYICRRRRMKMLIFRVWILLTALVLCFAVYTVDCKIRPILDATAAKTAQNAINIIINKTVAQVMKDGGISYEELVTVKYDDMGVVRSLTTDTVVLNIIKSEINKKVTNEIRSYECGEFGIRAGTLFASGFFAGRGPRLNFKFDLIGTATSELFDKFVSAGINQTKHQLKMKIDTTVTILMPWYTSYTDFSTDVLLDESIIAGTVPDTNASIELSTR